MLNSPKPIRKTFSGQHCEHPELQKLLKKICPTPGTLKRNSILAVQFSFQLFNTVQSPYAKIKWRAPRNVVWCGNDKSVRLLPWYTLQIENSDFQKHITTLANIFSLQSHFWCLETHQNAEDMLPKDSLGKTVPFSLFLAPGLGVLRNEELRDGPEYDKDMDFFLRHHSRIQLPETLTSHQKLSLNATPMITNFAHIVAPLFRPGTVEPVRFEHPLP